MIRLSLLNEPETGHKPYHLYGIQDKPGIGKSRPSHHQSCCLPANPLQGGDRQNSSISSLAPENRLPTKSQLPQARKTRYFGDLSGIRFSKVYKNRTWYEAKTRTVLMQDRIKSEPRSNHDPNNNPNHQGTPLGLPSSREFYAVQTL
ncbi:hypothetical protein J0895_15395 [Phormidium pseudopriestleyi FRX01]|uniref:Uncharacterized protein n=1 Tax=Phormidium pseudopriestleyi FRX01 TaxID=1759528 RepID=A0ABS3FTY5_9CYAN|nr:hypothetical protein [Phormidium pseudopriestleyi]MBO0350454.1 hypothetical protein [Phormidium pseudopriestleyi FRX01]